MGVVYSHSKLGFSDACTTLPCGNSTINASENAGWGYQLGTGAEYAMTNRWIIKAEYAYLDFGNTTIRGTGVGGGANGVLFHIPADLTAQTIKVGLNYQF